MRAFLVDRFARCGRHASATLVLPSTAALTNRDNRVARVECREPAVGASYASSYLELGSTSPELQGNRKIMVDCYLKDVHAMGTAADVPALHTAVDEQQGSGVVVRFVNWNVNVLMGPDSYGAVEPESVVAILSSLNADVVVMQETPIEWKDDSWKADVTKRGRGDELVRMRKLDEMLESMGYQLFRSPADNPTVLATRLSVRRSECGPRLDTTPVKFISQYGGGETWTEERAACYVELLLPGSQSVGVYATHLHHMDQCAAAGEGVRRREIVQLLEHFRRQSTMPQATVLLGDFNQPRQRDYSAKEWDVIAAGRRHVGEPEDDGVAGMLMSNGFSCIYDLIPARTNFGPRHTPPFTHWTGTTVDYVYVHAGAHPTVQVTGAFVCHTALSDHLPVVVDFRFH